MGEDRCAICLGEINPDTRIGNSSTNKYTLPCTHSYHVECILQAFRRGQPSCPLCRNIPEECVRRDPDEELMSMESIARLEWRKHNQVRNRWARKDTDCQQARETFWRYRELSIKLGKDYNTEITKSMKSAVRQVRKDFQKQRSVLRKTANKMYDADMRFDRVVEEKKGGETILERFLDDS